MGDLDPIEYMLFWAHLSPQPKRHLDWFSRYCRAHCRPTDQLTDHATWSVTIGHIYTCSTAMRRNNIRLKIMCLCGNWTTRRYTNSWTVDLQTSQLVDWTCHGLDSSRTGQVVIWSTCELDNSHILAPTVVLSC